MERTLDVLSAHQRISMKKLSFTMVLMLILVAPQANSVEIARNVKSKTINAATWSVVAVRPNQSTTFLPLVMSWTVSGGVAYDYFTFRNIGTVLANNFAVAITQRRVSGSAPANAIFFEQCTNGMWNTVTGACSGSIVLVGQASDLFLSFSGVSLAPSNEIQMRARTTTSNRNQFETSLSVQLSRNDIRAKQVIHS